jgi:hypothetical protein
LSNLADFKLIFCLYRLSASSMGCSLENLGRPQTHLLDKQTLSLINGLLSRAAYDDLEL